MPILVQAAEGLKPECAGIHLRTATRDGLKLGGKIGRFAFAHYLEPVK